MWRTLATSCTQRSITVENPLTNLRAIGADLVPAPKDVAKEADVVITILPADAELREAVFGPGWNPEDIRRRKSAGRNDHGDSFVVQAVAAATRSAGGDVLDAPVSGGTTAAEQGTLTIMAGGDTSVLERCRLLLETMGTRIVHVGPVGQGKVV